MPKSSSSPLSPPTTDFRALLSTFIESAPSGNSSHFHQSITSHTYNHRCVILSVGRLRRRLRVSPTMVGGDGTTPVVLGRRLRWYWMGCLRWRWRRGRVCGGLWVVGGRGISMGANLIDGRRRRVNVSSRNQEQQHTAQKTKTYASTSASSPHPSTHSPSHHRFHR